MFVVFTHWLSLFTWSMQPESIRVIPFLVFFVEIVRSIIVNEILDSFNAQQDFDLWDVFQPCFEQ